MWARVTRIVEISGSSLSWKKATLLGVAYLACQKPMDTRYICLTMQRYHLGRERVNGFISLDIEMVIAICQSRLRNPGPFEPLRVH